jgi:hypothetical protein
MSEMPMISSQLTGSLCGGSFGTLWAKYCTRPLYHLLLAILVE